MNTPSEDRVDRALAALRDAHELPEPDRALEARLLASHRWRRPARGRRWPLVLGAIGLPCAAAAAAGREQLRAWWFTVDVEGASVDGVVSDGASSTLRFATEDGGTATVAVEGETLADGATRTRIDVQRERPGSSEHEIAEQVAGGSDAGRELLDIASIAGLEPIHAWVDGQGDALALFVVPGDGNSGALLALQRPLAAPAALEVASRLPALSPDALPEFACETLLDGSVVVRVSERDAYEFELLVRTASGDNANATELITPDGQVKVRVEPDPGPPR